MSSDGGPPVKLTIPEAAAKLGKSPRQIRYSIKSGELPAQLSGGRWLIDASALSLSQGQLAALERKQRQLRLAVEDSLDLPAKGHRPRYSIRDLEAFQIALPLYQQSVEHLGAQHTASETLRNVLVELTQGCHRYDHGEKAACYRTARDLASQAVCALVLASEPAAAALVNSIEQDLMAALAGLLRPSCSYRGLFLPRAIWHPEDCRSMWDVWE